jgi:hypothetical protein
MRHHRSWVFREESLDEREQMRLELVGLAAEIATVTSLCDSELVGADAGATWAHGQNRCRSLMHMALLVLSEATRFERLSDAQLAQVLETFRALQRTAVELRYGPTRFADSLPVYLCESSLLEEAEAA